ncbi:hypothetical protein ACIRBY_28595 [Streptomyces sp. NPDC096136]|uniref:hypothetical protein n=1 Tax=Streptomyces sp. NPDC096136 TaxID=3366076 RepID=UPI0037F418D1
MSSGQCRAATKKGTRCHVEARPSGLCHVHDPEVRCRVRNAKGRPCVIASGGGPCDRHQGGEQAPVAEALKQVTFFESAGAESLFAVEEPAAPVPPAAAGSVPPQAAHEPQGPRLTFAFVARTFNWN